MNYVKLGGIISFNLGLKTNQYSGNRSRKLFVYGTKDQIKSFIDYAKKYKNELTKRNVIIEYKDSPNFYLELFGYDGELKQNIRKKELDYIINLIDKMPMGKIEKLIRDKFDHN